MGKRPMLTAACCTLLAQLTVLYASGWTYGLIIGAVGFQILLFVRVMTGKHIQYVWVPVIFLCLLVVWHQRLSELKEVEQTNKQYEDREVRIMGILTWMEKKGESQYLYLEEVQSQEGKRLGGTVLILPNTERAEFQIRQQIICQGKLSAFSESSNPGQFDEKSYYQAQGWYSRMYEPQIIVISAEQKSYGQYLYELRCYLRHVLETLSGGEDASVYAAMLLGDKTGLDEETKSLYQSGGISHILAISGLHMSLIGMGVYSFLRKRGMPFSVAALVCVFCIGSFAALSGSGVSSLRACLMLAFLLGADCVGRSYDLLSAMGLAWILLLMRYPYQLYQAGFQLSFAAILTLGTVMPIASGWMGISERARIYEGQKRKDGWKTVLFIGMVSSASIQFVTAPILVWHYYRISLAGLALNIIVIPLMSVLMVLLLFAVCVGGIGIWLGFTEVVRVASIILFPAHLILKLYELLCRLAEGIPYAILTTGRPRVWQIVLYYGILAIVLLCMRSDIRKRKEDIRKKLLVRLRLIVLTGITVIFPLILVRVRDKGLKLIVLDVGQGDGIFLQTQEGFNLFIDGGSSSVSGVGQYRIKPLLSYYGVTQIDYWFLSHPDSDHISGFLEVAEKSGEDIFEIGSVLLPAASMDMENWKGVYTVCARQGIPVYGITQGDFFEIDFLKIQCLYPDMEEVGLKDINELSQVLRLDYGGFSMLFTGDIGEETEELLLERYADMPRILKCDVLKVAHHGSKYSTGKNFLEAVEADYAFISCGNNRYGHPAPETLKRLEQAGTEVHITKEEGAIILQVEKEH